MNPVGSNCPIIIGIDSGYGNTKTAHFCFPTAVTAHDRESIFKMNLLVYNDRYYTIGEGRKEFVAEKAVDQDHYVLMLAGVAQELKYRNLTNARVHLAAGLPLTWVSVQKDSYGPIFSKTTRWISIIAASITTSSSLVPTSTRRASPLWWTSSVIFRASICFATSETAP